jgi:hypothetical protein
LSGAALIAGLAVAFRAPGFSPPGPLIQEEHFHEYEVRIYKRDDETIFNRMCDRLPTCISDLSYHVPGLREWSGVEILRNGRRVFSTYGGAYIGIAEFGSNSVVGMDITGDGTPNIALSESLGRQGGGSLCVFECGEKFRQIATVESRGTYPELKDLDGDGIPEVIASDDAFYHWPVCRDGEPIPEVILRWRKGKYVAAMDLMYKPAPPKEELEAMAAAIGSSPEWDAESGWVPPALWTNAISLMYGGHESLGWELVDKAWQPGFPGKKELIDYYLRSRLEQSVYAPDIVVVAKSSEPTMLPSQVVHTK